MDERKNGCLAALGIGIVGVIVAIFGKVIAFAAGWVGGWFLMTVFGNTICEILPIAYDTIPAWCGVLAVVGSAFSSVNTSTSKKEG